MIGLMRPRFRGARPNAKGEDASEASARSPERRPCAGGRRRLLTAYDVDRERKRKTAAALQLLLSQGRAVGVLVVAAVQDPGKDVIPFRDLFPTRVGLRLAEDEQVDMVLGRGARKRGAECDRIPTGLPGVGYVQLDSVREPVRVRAGHVTDADIAALMAAYVPQPLAENRPRCVVDDADTGEGVAA